MDSGQGTRRPALRHIYISRARGALHSAHHAQAIDVVRLQPEPAQAQAPFMNFAGQATGLILNVMV